MKPWTELLLQSQVSFMNDIIEQIPEVARGAFIGCLQGLADKSTQPAFKFYIVDGESGDVYGTNDEDQADLYSEREYVNVIDVSNNTSDTMKIKEAPEISEDDAE